ncbi:putative kinase-like protein TMKL1 [Cucurbita maxima]|uniref:Kinase-like protein TMKL1 n=1 Tax=Cucurbita maxima TaxID=3661 RepID=A0A6J1I3Q5_CUCMA|nr:putative kinase-like protein TMKL1 [Cucurbita maxima]
MLKFILLVASAAIFVLLLISIFFFFFFRHKLSLTEHRHDVERPCTDQNKKKEHTPPPSPPSLATFEGGEDLTIDEILEAPGEVIGKSHYGTLYKASLQSTQSTRLLRFLRPGAGGGEYDVVRFLGSIRHRNLVPMLGFYAGGRGERLLVHPFYGQGNLADLIRVGESETKNWEVINKISLGIARALDHLHNGLQKPIPHGNLKSKNILLDSNFEPHVSDFGLHLLLNAAATREMLQVSAASGYKAPELINMNDADERTDIFSYGKILLELLSAKETGGDGGDCGVSEERTLRCILQIGEACSSSSPDLRPNFKEVIAKIAEIGRIEMDSDELDCSRKG